MYDLAGNRVESLQPSGDILTSTYDASGRLVTHASTGSTESYTYDSDMAASVLDCATGTALGVSHGMGRLTAVEEVSGTTYFGYTPSGNVRFEARKQPGAACARTLRYAYNGDGSLASMRYPSGITMQWQYPAAGEPHMAQPSTVRLSVGSTSFPLATNVVWEAGALTRYTAGNGFTWNLQRWLDGSPRQWKVTRDLGGSPVVVRERTFGQTVSGNLEPRLDAHGSPLRMTEAEATWTQTFQTAGGFLTQATHKGDSTSYSYGSIPAVSDRTMVMTTPVSNPSALKLWESYTYDETTFRLSQVATTRVTPAFETRLKSYTYGAGGEVYERDDYGRKLSFCYDSKQRVAGVVGTAGQYTRQEYNFRRQRVREVWPVNGLVTDYWVAGDGSLLVESGAASLTAQYPRPVWEYVYLGGQPVAMVTSREAANGTTTYESVTYLFGGHLGELLLEADEGGHLVRTYHYTPFGAREALAPPILKPNRTLSRTGTLSTQVTLPAASASRLRFEGFSLTACDSVAVRDEAGALLVRLMPSRPATFWTDNLPAQRLQVSLEVGTCTGTSSLVLKDAQAVWGGAREVAVAQAPPQPYPATGFQVPLSLAPNSHVQVTGVSVASCDVLEARRQGTGQVLWTYVGGAGDTAAWTLPLSGAVDVGIWGTGCNATEGKGGFAVAKVHSVKSPDAAANLHLPGQRMLAPATERRGASNDVEATVLENWNRYYDPRIGRYLQPEPLTQDPEWMHGQALRGLAASTYAYANNNPVHFVDPDGNSSLIFPLSPPPRLPPGATPLDELLCALAPGICDFEPPPQPPGACPVPGQTWMRKSNSKYCEQQKKKCIAKCTAETLPTGEPAGDPFYKCLADCMRETGCRR